MATLEDTIDQAGMMLGITGVGRPLRAEHTLMLAGSYRQVHDDLSREDIGNLWPINGAIPDSCQYHVAALIAFNVTEALGVSEERYSRVLARRNIAKPEIRRLTMPDYESYQEADEY